MGCHALLQGERRNLNHHRILPGKSREEVYSNSKVTKYHVTTNLRIFVGKNEPQNLDPPTLTERWSQHE